MSVAGPLVRSRRLGPLVAALLLAGTVACAPISTAATRLVPSEPAPVAVAQPPAAPNPGSIAVAPPAVQQAAELPAGRILYVRDSNLWLWQGGASHQFSDGGTWTQPSFSPGGKEIAYIYWESNFSDLFVMGADGSNNQRLTRNQAAMVMDNSWAFRPAFSPDGERLAYASDANSRFPQLWLIGKDGSNRRQVTLDQFYEESWVDALTWDPKGGRLAVTGAPNMRDPSHIYLVDLALTTTERLTNHPNGAFDPSWSPDGSAIAYIGRPGQVGELWVRTVDSERMGHVEGLSFVRSPTWSPDGKSLAFLAQQNGAFEIFVLSVRATETGFEFGEPRQLTRDAAVDPMSGLTWTR